MLVRMDIFISAVAQLWTDLFTDMSVDVFGEQLEKQLVCLWGEADVYCCSDGPQSGMCLLNVTWKSMNCC